jgi:hypothetical protein
MAKMLYCWRCRTDIPMLEEHEWEQVLPALYGGIEQVRRFRRQIHGTSFSEVKEIYGKAALEKYFKITGFLETNINALWHHRLSLFGPPCHACGKPLRTPRAKLCVECGTQRLDEAAHDTRRMG